MNDRDMILTTILNRIVRISRSLFILFFSLSSVTVALFIHFFQGRFCFSLLFSGICSCILSIHTVDHWVVF